MSSFVQATAFGGFGTQNPFGTFANPVVSGNAIIVYVSWSTAAGSVLSVTDSESNVYTAIANTLQQAQTKSGQFWISFGVTGGSGFVVTANLSAAETGSYVEASELTGLTGAINQSHSNNGVATTAPTSGNITTTVPNCLLFGCYRGGAVSGFEWTSTGQSYSQYDQVSSTGIYAATWTTASNQYIAAIVALAITVGGNPTVSTPVASNVSTTGATLSSSIVSTGGFTITAEGFNWGTTSGYGNTVNVSPSGGTGPFNATLTGLSKNTIYHFQSFATNSNGTVTSSDQTFLTSIPFVNNAPLPPRGWNAWRAYGNNATDAEVRANALAMTTNGMKAAGYTFVDPSAAWNYNTARSGGVLQSNLTNFPSGVGATLAYVQSLGLTPALYLNPGPGMVGCSGGPGSAGNETLDVSTIAAWGVKHLMYDSCYDFSTAQATQQAYGAMGLALQANLSTADCIFMVSCPQYADGTPFGANCVEWFGQVGGNVVYSSTNLTPITYANMMSEIDEQVAWAGLSGPGAWFECDLLAIGTNSFTDAEGRSQFYLYCVLACPLWASCDLTSADAGTIATLTNTEAIAVNQDPLGLMGVRYAHNSVSGSYTDVWAKQLSGGQWAICLANRTSVSQSISATWSMFGQSGPFTARDVINHANLGVLSTGYSTSVASHDVAMLVLTPYTPYVAITVAENGYYVTLNIYSAYHSMYLFAGTDYAWLIQSVISGPYPDTWTAQAALIALEEPTYH